jgi:hypothetical protein
MTLTPAEQNHILEAESAWVDQSFGQLDLSQFPSLQPPPPEEKHDDKFARSWEDNPLSRSASNLRAFVENPDLESLDRVGAETGIPEYAAEVRERRAETVAQAFKRRCPGYLPTQRNLDAMVETLAFNALSTSEQDGDTEELIDRLALAGKWTIENLQACYLALNREGLLELPAGEARPLSTSEKLDVSRLAQNGRQFEAIDKFLQYSLPDEEPGVEILTDPAYRELLDTAVLYVWELAQEDYSPTAERREFIQNFAAGRPLTLTLIGSAWTACQDKEKRYERGELLEQYQRPEDTAPPTAKELDAMDDQEFQRLYRDSIRAYAQQIRGAGVLV